MKHLPFLPSSACAPILAGSAHGASLDVARRALMLMMRLLPFGDQKPFVYVMIDKVPRQQLVVDVMTGDEKIGVRQRRRFSGLDFAMNLRQLVPDGSRSFTARRFQPFQDAANSAIAARDHRLEIRFA